MCVGGVRQRIVLKSNVSDVCGGTGDEVSKCLGSYEWDKAFCLCV